MYTAADIEQEVQDRLRDEVEACEVEHPSHDELQNLPFLTSIIFESLRMFPPISQLINRKVSEPVMLGSEIYVPKDTYIGYNCYSTNRDPKAWGPSANAFQPERWGRSNQEILSRYRRSKARAEFISFHGGKRACLGEKLALLEMRVSLFVLVKKFSWSLDPEWPDRKTPVSCAYTVLGQLRCRCPILTSCAQNTDTYLSLGWAIVSARSSPGLH